MALDFSVVVDRRPELPAGTSAARWRVAAKQLSVLAPKVGTAAKPEDLSGHRIGVPRSSARDDSRTEIAPADAEILRFDAAAAALQAPLSGQVEMAGANQFPLQRLDTARPGVYENELPLIALCDGVGARLGEADGKADPNAFLADFIQAPDDAAIYQKGMQLDPPAFPASPPNELFTLPD